MDDEKKTGCCGCSQRKKEHTPEEYKRLIHRLNRIEGQIRGIRERRLLPGHSRAVGGGGRGAQCIQ